VGDHFETGRLEAFSDGVFAIAITLLVLELSVPEDDFDDLLAGILDQWPSYLAYLTSFLTIGGVWLVHHAIVRRMRYADTWFVRVNLLLLLAVSFLPFPTKLVAEAIASTSAERVAVLFYGATLFVISAIVAAMGRYVAAREAFAGRE
jgi:TMEM175 potassium channel family protein